MTASHELKRAEDARPDVKTRVAASPVHHQQPEALASPPIDEQVSSEELYERLDLVLGLDSLSPPWTPVESSVSSHPDSLPMTQQAPTIFEKAPRSNPARGVFDSSTHKPFFSRNHDGEKEKVARGADWLAGCRRLFDEHGVANQRLGQALRRLAKYVVDEYAPKKSLVITPDKIAAFYTAYGQESDVFPFVEIFTSTATDANDCLEDFFDRLQCEHLLVQKDIYSRPRIPALSVDGFARYLAICVLAYPHEEIRRLDRIFADLPLTLDMAEEELHDDNAPGGGMLKTIPEAYQPIKHDRVLRKRLDDAFAMLMLDLKMTTPACRAHRYTLCDGTRCGREADDYFSALPKSSTLSPIPYWVVKDNLVKAHSPRESPARSVPGTPRTLDDDGDGNDRSNSKWNRHRERSPPRRWAASSNSSRSGDFDIFSSRLTPNLTSPTASRDALQSRQDARPPDQQPAPVKRVTFYRKESPQLRLNTAASVPNIQHHRGPSISAPSSAVCTPTGYSSPLSPPLKSHPVSPGSWGHHRAGGRRYDEGPTIGPLSPLTVVSPRHADARPYHERWRSLDGKVEFGREYRGDKRDSYVGQGYSGRSSGEKNGDSPRPERERKRDVEPERRSSYRCAEQQHQRSSLVRTESNNGTNRGRSYRDDYAHKREHRRGEETATERRH